MQAIKADPDIMHGTPCFSGTRVPVASLFDHLRQGYPLEYFLAQFPSVKREQAEDVLDLAKQALTNAETGARAVG
ncbi:MAG TPA: DUF433 domain-containing protein [Phycisphaerales bacterium]|nr:DUF433 domain-containing protein [Phycisphaerales bacterium]